MLKKILFRMAKSPFMGSMVGEAFQYCSRLIPVKKIYNGKEVIAFYHPQPSYQNHVIIVPKKAIKNGSSRVMVGKNTHNPSVYA
ncbi:MAG: hypothetical protein OSJ72_17975, partial [Lachnospiraceae bacterium]|nr:hypothetical protein [Lachnospiraceae bacterium]